MKKTIQLLLLLTTVFITTSANAKEKTIPLEDSSKILGKWNLNYEAAALHKEKKKVNITWDFKKDGILNTAATDTRSRTGAMSINVKYSIEDGAIKKQSSPGREKYEMCRVVKLEDKDMVLHCQYLYFFLTR
jgi:hypothetical protein